MGDAQDTKADQEAAAQQLHEEIIQASYCIEIPMLTHCLGL